VVRIAVSADTKNGLDSVVCPHFGRCPHFILVDVDGEDVSRVREVDNPFYGQHRTSRAPSFISILGADVMLTGGMDGQAVTLFQRYGIKGVTGAHGTVSQSVENYLDGELQSASAGEDWAA
jgi:predicted Fe-Mo cluster-binding NifX family protein